MSFREVYIHIDSFPNTWGDGELFTEEQTFIRPNINFKYSIDVDSYILNNSNNKLLYNPNPSANYPSLPVRYVKHSGDSTYIDIATQNSAESPIICFNKFNINNGVVSYRNGDGFGFFIVGLNQTPKQSNGQDAIDTVSWTDAVYYEIVLDYYSPDFTNKQDFLVFQQRVQTQTNYGTAGNYRTRNGLGYISFDSNFKLVSKSPRYYGGIFYGLGLYLVNGSSANGQANIIFSSLSTGLAENLISTATLNYTSEISPNDILSLEMKYNELRLLKYATDGSVESKVLYKNANDLSVDNDLYILPFFFCASAATASVQGSYSFDQLKCNHPRYE